MGIEKRHIDEKGDEMLRDLFKQDASEVPSDFMDGILRGIHSESEVFEYEPVISKMAWKFIISGFVIVMLSLFWVDSKFSVPSWLELKDLTIPFDWSNSFDTVSNWFNQHSFELPFTLVAALAVLVVSGLYFIMTFQFWKSHFEKF